MPKISIITAVYNGEKYLRETIKTVLDQTFPDWEYLIVDDGSSDTTKDIVNAHLFDRRIQYHYQHNQGQAVARNIALSLAKGKYIAILDADDIWQPQKLERQIDLFERNSKLGLVYTGIQKIDENGQNMPTSKTADITRAQLENQIVSNKMAFSSFLFKRDCINSCIHDPRYPITGDQHLSLLIILKGWDIGFIPERLLKYRIHSKAMSRSLKKTEDEFREKLNLIEEFRDGSVKKGLSLNNINKAIAMAYLGRAVDYIRWGNANHLKIIDENIKSALNQSKNIGIILRVIKWYIYAHKKKY